MEFKATGSSVLWVIALVGGLLLGREFLRQRLVGMIEDVNKQSANSPPMDFNKPLEITISEPIFPAGVLYNPENP